MAKKIRYIVEFDGFASRLDKLRIDNDMTQEQLADVMKCERKTVNRILNGYGNVNLFYIIKICEYFKVSADWLIFGKEK